MSDALKAYASPWDGRLILACKKCQKKMKEHPEHGALARLKKAIKEKQSGGERIHVLNVPCMDVCPKRGVAVVDPRQRRKGLYILRDEDDLDGLIESLAISG